jgi:arginyl-tRNA synthetase
MATSVKEIDPHLTRLTHEALRALGVEERPSLAPPPRAEMGYLGLACFPYAKALGKAPVAVAEALRDQLRELTQGDPLIEEIHTEGPFLNFRLSRAQMLRLFLEEIQRRPRALGGDLLPARRKLLIEYSSPNTNKPQHLGHVRNNLLGESVANVLDHVGYEVVRINLVNDRGIHICKSMLAYKRFGEGVTPQSAQKKGDHLIGDFYVRFEAEFQKEYKAWQQGEEAQAAFARWQEGPGARKAIQGWQKERRQKNQPPPEPEPGGALGSVRERLQRQLLQRGVGAGRRGARDAAAVGGRGRRRRGPCGGSSTTGWRRGSGRRMRGWACALTRWTTSRRRTCWARIWSRRGCRGVCLCGPRTGRRCFALERIGLSGEKAVLRPDGTSLYTTQDLGTAARRFARHQPERMVYVVGDEQNHHFEVLFGILGELDGGLKGRCQHLSYGMVNLPSGRMKSREGTVVDADDLMDEVHAAAEATTREIYKEEPLSDEELHRRAEGDRAGGVEVLLVGLYAADDDDL